MYTESYHTGEYIVHEPDANYCRTDIYLRTGNLAAGTVLGRTITSAAGGNTGNGTIGTLTAHANAPQGVYTLTCTAESENAGTFSVVAPDGSSLGNATVAVAFDNVIGFTIADGSTDFATDDSFTITVGCVLHNPAGTDGEAAAAGILYAATDASSAAQWAVMTARDTVIDRKALTWKSGATAAQKNLAYVQLEALGIKSLVNVEG